MAGLLAAVLLSSCASRQPYAGTKHAPYTVFGQRYHPLSPRQAVGGGFVETGIASHYRERRLFRSGPTALGEPFRARRMEGAHKTLPIPSRVRVTNLENGRQVVVRLNDRGPFVSGRVIDLTPAAADRLGFRQQGLAPVRVELLSVGDFDARGRARPFPR